MVYVSPDGQAAIVSGGAPRTPSGGAKCVAGNQDVAADELPSDGGLWLLTREQVPAQSLVEGLRAKAEALGFDTSILRPVPQQGCQHSQAQAPRRLLRRAA